MLKKLLKHEFRATARIFAPLLGAALILSGATWIVVRLGGILILSGGTDIVSIVPIGSPIFGLFSGILMLLSILALFALMVAAVLVTVQRFYKNLLGDEGYLMFSLPVTPGQHIAAKLIVGTVWSAAALLLMLGILTVLILSVPGAASYGLTFANLLAACRRTLGVPLGAFFGVSFCTFLAGITNSYLLAYLSMSIGSRRQESRLFASVAAYVVLNAALMVLYLIVMAVSGAVTASLGILQTAQAFVDSLPPFTVACIFMGVSSGVLLAGDVIYFFITRALLTKKLNLA